MIALRRAGHATPWHRSQWALGNANALAQTLIARGDELHRAKIQVLKRLKRPVAKFSLNHQSSIQLDKLVHHQFERTRIGAIAKLDSR